MLFSLALILLFSVLAKRLAVFHMTYLVSSEILDLNAVNQ